ncbi:MAG: hypothetical protein LH650_05675 [Chloroflexi bacterium]|nr:hypothetical protein [Chloroflexota bacterium]
MTHLEVLAMSLTDHAPRRLAAALLSGLLLVSFVGSAAIAQSPSPAVEQPAASPDPTDGAIPVVPDPRIISAMPQPWTHIDVAPDGTTLTVYFWNGAAACNGLRDVVVSVVGGVTTVTVMTGLTPEALFTTCVAALFQYKTTVVLDAPILGGGAI